MNRDKSVDVFVIFGHINIPIHIRNISTIESFLELIVIIVKVPFKDIQ